ncbi:MAG TPA: hypothetical protein DCF91_13840 [Porphyromonadaceae bacterium]|nr:hypothetical protein [Porphyromonadaceae bacterium]
MGLLGNILFCVVITLLLGLVLSGKSALRGRFISENTAEFAYLEFKDKKMVTIAISETEECYTVSYLRKGDRITIETVHGDLVFRVVDNKRIVGVGSTIGAYVKM